VNAAAPYPVVDANGWEALGDEAAGLDEKTWLIEPGSDELWLFGCSSR
jgi:hypothetical protein